MPRSHFKLAADDEGYYLADTLSKQKPLRIQFDAPEFLYRLQHASRRSELILRAVKAKAGLKVLDCTAGLGREAFLLAYKGCQVTMLERSRALATMLADAIARAAQLEELADTTQRLHLCRTDARHRLRSLAAPIAPGNAQYDVIYIDPMFPGREKSALVKGEMQLLQRFLGKDEDAAELVSLALATGAPRLVVKRPAPSTGNSIWQAPLTPTAVFTGKASKFEVIVRPPQHV